MRGKWQKSAVWIAAAAAVAAMTGCSQDIGDIDRTEPNKVLKKDLTEGTWWMGQKVVSSSSTAMGIFGPSEGSMAENDKIRFIVEENYLMAYRSYPILPGSEDTTLNLGSANNYEELYDDNYKGSVRAMFPIKSHFDVQRQYDTSTGEQSNVIVENTSDRPWYERAYMRVSWEDNMIVDPWWLFGDLIELDLGYMGSEGGSEEEMEPYFERDSNGLLVYFDVPASYVAKPTIYDLIYYLYNYSFADPYAGTEIRVVTSFARDLTGLTTDGDTIHVDTYEPLPYDNYDMNRFGFFLQERMTYDNANGIMNAGKIQLANRHHIWENDYTTDAAGNKIALPIEERVVKTTPFYIHGETGDDHLDRMSEQIIDEWNVAFKRAAYIMQHPNNTVISGKTVPVMNDGAVTGSYEQRDVDLVTEIDYEVLKAALADQTDVFVACHVPVVATDPDICLPTYLAKQGVPKVGYTPREGDFRKNYLWLVNQNLENGLLGYGPTADDPLTSLSMSSQAHVYTAYMNVMANSIIQHLQYLNGEIDEEGIRANDAAVARAQAGRDKFIELSKLPSAMRNANLDASLQKNAKKTFNVEREARMKKLEKFNYANYDARLKKLTESGRLASGLDEDISNTMKKRMGGNDVSRMAGLGVKDTDVLFTEFSAKNRAYKRELNRSLAEHGYCYVGSTADSIINDAEHTYYAKKYAGRSDYDEIRRELRAEIHRSTSLHEMGHTMGLRHNFAGSFDTMNYFDNYWTQRTKSDAFKPGKTNVSTIKDLYSIWDITKEQMEGGMNHSMYSSIMDYYSDDKHGLGKYDHAAITYAYSGGTSYVYDNDGNVITDVTACSEKGGEVVDFYSPKAGTMKTACQKFQKGLVEVFAKSATDKSIATRSDIGNQPYDILTHKDTTGISTFDDPISVGQPYLELVHYRDFFGRMNAGYDFKKSRRMMRLEDYLARKDSGSDRAVRVPYLFCTDDVHGKLASCYTFDQGADLFEQVLYYVSGYETNYWFRDFARGRAYWDAYYSAMGGYQRNFLRLSDLFQHWYAADRSTLEDVMGDEVTYDVNYQTGEIAVNAIMNHLASVIATPEYGIFCKRSDANALVGLSTEDEARSDVSEFSTVSNCGMSPDYYYVRQGEGRNRFYRYDVSMGFDYSPYELENPHLYTTIAAIMALFDNEADVIVNTGDMNTYLFGLYDYFREEITELADAAYAENYTVHSPVLERKDSDTTTFNGEEYRTGSLKYPPLAEARFYLDGSYAEFDPLSGQTLAAFNKAAATVPAFGACSSDSECILSDSARSGYCTAIYKADSTDRCFSAFSSEVAAGVTTGEHANVCPENTSLQNVGGDVYFCLPTDAFITAHGNDIKAAFDALAAAKCSAANPEGACAANQHCNNGTCVASAMRVETETSRSQKLYLIYIGMLLTGMYGSENTYYDQFNIYRVGSGETVTPGTGYEVVTFEDPYTGAIYAANDHTCTSGDSIWCNADNREIRNNAGAMILKRANALKARVEDKYNELLSLEITDADEKNNTEAYQNYMEVMYEWYGAKYDLEDVIYDINFVRSAYSFLGTLF